MATVRELKAMFTAETKGLQNAFRAIRQESAKLGTETKRTTDQVNKNYNGLITSTEKLEKAIKDSGDPDAFDDLNKAIKKSQDEMSATGKVSSTTMDELNRAVQGSVTHLDSLGDEARASFRDIESAITDVNSDFLRLGADTGLDSLNSAAQSSSSNLNNLGNAANETDQNIGNLGGDSDLNNLNDDLSDTESNLDDLIDELDNVGDSTGDAEESLENFGDAAERESRNAEGSFGKLGGAVMKVGGLILGAFALDKIKDFGQELAETAGAAEASKAQFSTVFGDMEGEAAKRLSAIGGEATILENRMKDSFTKIAAFAKTGGMDTADSLDLADRSMRAVADSAAFYDRSLEDTTESLQSFLKGNFENDAALGLSSTETTRNAAANELYGKSFKDLSEAQKQLTSLQMVEDANKLTGALGQASRESEGWENVVGNMNQAWTDFKAEIGAPVLKVAVAGLKGMTAAVQSLNTEAIGNGIEKAFNFIAGAIGKAKDALEPFQQTFGAIKDTFAGVSGSTESIFAKWGLDPAKMKPLVDGVDTVHRVVGALKTLLNGEGETAENVFMSWGLGSDTWLEVAGHVETVRTLFGALRDVLSGVGETTQNIFMAWGLGSDAWLEVAGHIETVRTLFGALKDILSGEKETAQNIFMAWGLSSDTMLAVASGIEGIKNTVSNLKQNVLPILREIGGNVKSFLIDIWPSVKLAVSAVVGFVVKNLAKIMEFWQANGPQFLEAVSNVFSGIMKVVNFVMPLVLGIIKMVWTNIKGVISGALNFIMGLVKVFSGLFTGDFSKMWEGLKQMFLGAVTFLWNFIQLTFFGKILSGAKIFVLSFRTFFVNMWSALVALFKGNATTALNLIKAAWSGIFNSTKTIFTNILNFFKNTWASIKSITTGFINGTKLIFSRGWSSIRDNTTNIFRRVFDFLKGIWSSIRDSVSGSVSGILNKVRDTWSALRNNTSNAFRDIYNGIKSRFTNIVDLAKGLPQRIGDGIGAMASKVTSGVTKVINKLATTLGKGVNGVIGGVNWVLGKIGVDTDIPKWTVPQYAQGTKHERGAHPGGPMIVGDGKGSNRGPELIETPDGKQMLSPSKPTLMHGEEGTKVWSATETRKIMDTVPHYAWGDLKDDVRAAGDWIGDKYNSGKEKVKAVGSKIKDVAVDAFEYIKEPGKFLDLALKTLGIEKPKSGNFIGDMAVGAWNKTKSAAINFVKEKLEGYGATQSGISVTGGNGGGFGAPFRLTSKPGPRNTGIPGASRYHKGWDWGAPAGTPIPSVSDGVGWRVGYHPLSGNYVEVKSGSKVHRYQHNTRNMIRVGQPVKKGQTVGTVGSTGVSSGPHLHYELKGYEKGGIINKEHTALVGEGNKKEAIIPLEKHRTRALGLWKQAGDALGVSDQGMAVLYNEQSKVIDALEDILMVLSNILESVVENGMIASSMRSLLAKSVESNTTAAEPAEKAPAPKKATTPKKTTASKKTTTVTPAQKKALEEKQRADALAKQKKAAERDQALKRQKEADKKAKAAATSAESKYLAVVRKDGDWMNDWATHVPESKRKALFLKGYNLAKSLGFSVGKYGRQHLKRLTGYADGGIVDTAQLAWIAEGGWAESIISHDPAKRVSQKAIWEQTGKELGFNTSDPRVISLLERIAQVSENGHSHDIVMSERAVAKAIAPHVKEFQELKGKLKQQKL